MIAKRPERCPRCGAPLRPPPPAQPCAACGLPLDDASRIWRSQRSWHHYAVAYGLLGLGAGLAAALLRRLAVGEIENALLPILTGLAVAVVGLTLHRILTGRLTGRFVAITPAGLIVGTRRENQLLPWGEIRRVRIQGRVPSIELKADPLPVVLEDVFHSAAELAEFRSACQTAQARYGPAADNSR